jgi:hypothetical protein
MWKMGVVRAWSSCVTFSKPESLSCSGRGDSFQIKELKITDKKELGVSENN